MHVIAITRAIEIAEHNGCYEGDTLVVFDARHNDPHYGIRVTVAPVSPGPGWRAEANDGVGNSHWVYAPTGTRDAACRKALTGYLKLIHHGL